MEKMRLMLVDDEMRFLSTTKKLRERKGYDVTAACDIIQPEKYHRRLGLKDAQQFIEKCRLGQTEN